MKLSNTNLVNPMKDDKQHPLTKDEILELINDIDEIEDLNFWEKEAIIRGIRLAEKIHGIT